jgi:pilus assembly protein CpaF
VQAAHSGHDGVITVVHANSPEAALERLQTMMLMSGLDLSGQACRMQIASAIDLVIHMGRFADGSRRVASITQVLGATATGFQLEDLFVFDVSEFGQDGTLRGGLRYTGARPKFFTKFQLNNVPLPEWMQS